MLINTFTFAQSSRCECQHGLWSHILWSRAEWAQTNEPFFCWLANIENSGWSKFFYELIRRQSETVDFSDEQTSTAHFLFHEIIIIFINKTSSCIYIYIFIERCLLLANVYYSMFLLEKKDNNQILIEKYNSNWFS